ncbi:uncharacterized protein LOC126907265 [Daktulosphaira vitifoliae]|uniref:uncharacterized protein LOC126907265 n=1 Tax=Daktulosphaira vitifoliae TaxID=58002 RepID=UPI0021AB01AF|nr:uncharacterized protein LOC126907265 [Daktulosphaira vitifoliae]
MNILRIILIIVQIVFLVQGIRNVKPEGPCEPGELVFVGYCNLCKCNNQGIPNQICAKSWCSVNTTFPITVQSIKTK